MSISQDNDDSPPRDNVPSGTYAIRVGKQQQIWRLQESPDPFSDDLEWDMVGKRPIDSVPKSDYDGGRWEADQKGTIWFYVEDINPKTESEPQQLQLDDTAPFSLQLIGPNGSETHNVSGQTQADVFAEAIEILIEQYGLDGRIEMPFVPGYKNAVVAREPRNPNGEEMRRYRVIADEEYYVSTTPTKGQKRDYLEQFAEATDVSFRFGNGWDD